MFQWFFLGFANQVSFYMFLHNSFFIYIYIHICVFLYIFISYVFLFVCLALLNRVLLGIMFFFLLGFCSKSKLIFALMPCLHQKTKGLEIDELVKFWAKKHGGALRVCAGLGS